MIFRLMQFFLADGYEYKRKAEEKWLAQSTDLVDLERRQKQLTYGKRLIF